MPSHRVHPLRPPEPGLTARLAVAAALVVAGAGQARGEERVTRIGVVTATRINLTSGEADALSAGLGDELRHALVVDVIAGADARHRLPAGGVADLCVVERACVRDVAARLNADELLFLIMVKAGKQVRIDVAWFDASGSRSASRASLVIDVGRSPRSVFAANATRLLPGAPHRPSTAEPAAVVALTPAVVALPPPRATTGFWIAGATAVAALGGGIGFGIAAKRAEDDLDAGDCDQVACPQERVDALKRHMVTADVLFGAAAASAVVAAVLYWRSDGPAKAGVTVTGNGGAAVTVGGRF